MRLIRVLLSITILISTVPANAAMSDPGGKSCNKAGLKTTFKNVTYQCKKSGNKLIWVKGAKVVTTPVATYLSSRDAKAGALCRVNGQESFPMSGPLRCVSGKWINVDRSQDSVATRAFRSVLEKYNANPPAKLTFKFLTDPKFTGSIEILMASKEAAARLWNKPDTPFQPYPIVIGSNLDWIKKTTAANNLKTNTGDFKNIENQFSEWQGCSYAEFYSQTGQPWYVYCYSQPESEMRDSIAYLQVGAHEYTHLIQFYMADSTLKRFGDSLPPWIQEGFAMFVGISLGAAAKAGNDIRSLELEILPTAKTPLSDYMERFPPNWNDVYVLGYLASEALVALKGIDIMEEIILEQKNGSSKEAAIQKATGKSLKFWTQIGQGYVDSVKAGKPWSLAELEKRAS